MHYDFCNEQSLRTRAFELFSSRNAASRSWRTHRHRARELISKIGTIENGDYYYDQNDDQPIPLESDQIVVLMGGWIAVVVPCAFALFMFMPFVKMMRDGPASVIDQDHPIVWSVMLGVDLLIVIFLVALSVFVF